MTIEESVVKDSSKFEAVLATKVSDVQSAIRDLSAKLDVIYGGAIREYCEAEQVEANVDDIPSYKTVNKLITGQLDFLIGEHIKEKRKDL